MRIISQGRKRFTLCGTCCPLQVSRSINLLMQAGKVADATTADPPMVQQRVSHRNSRFFFFVYHWMRTSPTSIFHYDAPLWKIHELENILKCTTQELRSDALLCWFQLPLNRTFITCLLISLHTYTLSFTSNIGIRSRNYKLRCTVSVSCSGSFVLKQRHAAEGQTN